jgi:glycosyltransferase involved in cell wall biosynthesis
MNAETQPPNRLNVSLPESSNHLRSKVLVCHVCMTHNADDGRVHHQFVKAGTDAGYNVHLFASAPVNPVNSAATIHFVRKDESRIRRAAESWRVAFRVRKLKPDIVHVHEPLLLGPVVRVCRSSKVIWDVHEDYIELAKSRYWIPEKIRIPIAKYWDKSEGASSRRCAAVTVAVSSFVPRYSKFNKRVVVLRNFPVPGPEAIHKADALPLAVYTGTILADRGLEESIHAMAIIRDRGVALRFEIAGPCDDDYMKKMMELVKKLDLEDRVQYHGRLSRTDTLALQRRATIGLVPHLRLGSNNIAWSVKMIEFMEASLPIVYSDLQSHRDIAGTDDIGIMIDPLKPTEIADALIAFTEPTHAARCGANGRRAVLDRLSWTAEKQGLVKLYDEISAIQPT